MRMFPVLMIGILFGVWGMQHTFLTKEETLKRVGQVCTKECKAAKHAFSNGLIIDPVTEEVTCFCRVEK